jgi:hypothetical protein
MIKGTCSVCGFVFLLDYGLACPACHMTARVERVRQTFAPIDPLRTALGITGINYEVKDEAEDLKRFWHGMRQTEEEPEVKDTAPKGCKLPLGSAAQIYELKRMRKLIGKLWW